MTPTLDKGWVKYTGEYEKKYYDIKLFSGTIVEHCYPNANTFHNEEYERPFLGKNVIEIKESERQFEL